MKPSSLIKWAAVAALTLITAVPCVFAAWSYSFLPVESKGIDFSYTLAEFYYKPEEVLPGDNEATTLHENHLNLINNIVNHIDYGLNATKKPIVKNLLLKDKDKVYSNQSVSGGNLKHMLLNTSDVESLAFVVQYVTDTEFSAYTFSTAQADYVNMDTYIEVYKTQIVYENGKWMATRSFTGKAKVFRPGIVDVSVDVDGWIKT